MISHEFLYNQQENLEKQLAGIDGQRPSLIQMYTNALLPDEAVALAQSIQKVCPQAQIIGTSVSGVIYQGEQYDNCTLVVAEQYDNVGVETHMVALEHKTYAAISQEMDGLLGGATPALVRMFIGAYYDYAHQLIAQMNQLRPGMKIVGGMAGELQPFPKEVPFVFNANQWLQEGLVFATLQSPRLMVYGRVNTAHEPIGDVYTITETRDRAILAIEGEPAQGWLQRNFGVLSTKEYETWEEIAKFDPLVRLQLALQEHKHAIRFIHYDESKDEITQYFSRLPAGSKFRISYTSPSKCAEESRESCREVAATPIEQLFCYSCLFRKLYLKNCSKWELSPYHKNPLSGVFLLGEFGYGPGGNTLLNGSCVLSGVAEQERYLSVDMSCLDSMDDIRNEDEKLMDFIIRKGRENASQEHLQILEHMIAHESNQLVSPYQRMRLNVPVGNMSQYEQDKEHLHFNKLCMVRVENADAIVSQRGQLGYFTHLKFILEQLSQVGDKGEFAPNLHYYSIKDNTFLVAANVSVNRHVFVDYIYKLQGRCDEIQKMQTEMPFLLRFVLVRNHPFLLERSYALMESCKQSQHHVVLDDRFDDEELTPVKIGAEDELASIQLIQYALEHDQLVPYYQGIYNNQTGTIDRYEALMRLRGRDGKIYAPGYFMEISKKYRLYLDLNLKMFQAVLQDCGQLDCNVSINLSVHDILSTRFCQAVRDALRTYQNPANLTFELLEDECASNIDDIKGFIAEVRSYGVKIAVDDFGAGYSNLLEIINIRPDFIKIDGEIIRNLGKNRENASILEAVSLLGQRLSMELVAEFVETEAIQAQVLSHGISHSQGYLFAKPQPIEAVRLTVETGVIPVAEEAPVCSAEPSQEEERNLFQAMQALTADLLFRFDLTTGQTRYFGGHQTEFDIPNVIENCPQGLIDTGLVATDDVPALLASVNQMRQGVEKAGYFRILNRKNEPIWHRMDYKVVLDQRKVPVGAIGKLTNIQAQKELEARINIDAMTGCLRKDAFETLVADYMHKNPKGRGVLFIVDLDNFKAVNDNLGHQFGDQVLRGVGDKLRALFRGDDFVGRIGGDEFMVMMIGTDDMDVVKKKASDILSALDATYTGSVHAYHVSASLGIAKYPMDGNSFQALYDHADMAMFDAKNRGKNGYVIYHNTLSKGTMENTLPYEVAARTLAQHYDPRVVEETFNLLFETKDFDISIQAVLELIGKRFGVSRCYIFEQHPTMCCTYQNTYEWCNPGIQSEIGNLQAVPADVLQEFFDQANGDGVLYCNDLAMLQERDSREIMESQGIKSFLHTYIASEGTISYTLGVDECNMARVWTPIEVSTILQASKIIAQFLSYKKAMLDAKAFSGQQLAALDSLHYFAYIVDTKTHGLTYFNQYTRENAPHIKLGQTCYEAIRQKDAPCEDCPLHRIQETGDETSRSVIADTAFGQQLLTVTTLRPDCSGKQSAYITAIPLDDIGELTITEK